jgi:hypothetical protein
MICQECSPGSGRAPALTWPRSAAWMPLHVAEQNQSPAVANNRVRHSAPQKVQMTM